MNDASKSVVCSEKPKFIMRQGVLVCMGTDREEINLTV